MPIQVDKEQELKTSLILVNRNQYSNALNYILSFTHDQPCYLFDALTALYKHLSLHFHNNYIRIIITELYLSQGYYNDAILELEEAYLIDPYFSQIYLILSKIYPKTSYKKRIQTLFEDAINQSVYDSSIIDLLPKIYLEEKNTSKNISLFEKLIANKPKQLHYYKVLAELYRSVQYYDKAGNVLKKMVDFSSKLAPDAAKQCFTMIKFCPMNFELRQLLIHFLWQSCDPERAHIQIQELCRLDNSYTPIAIKDYRTALTTFPNNKDLLIGISTLLIETQSYSESISYIELLYEYHPKNIKYVYSLLQLILDRCPQQLLAIQFMATLKFNDNDISHCLKYISQMIDIKSKENEFILLKLTKIKAQFSQFTPLCNFLMAKFHFSNTNYEDSISLLNTLSDTEFEVDAASLNIQIQLKLDKFKIAQQLSNDALKKYPYSFSLHSLFSDLQNNMITKQINSITIQSAKDHFESGLLYLRKGELHASLEKFQNIPTQSSFILKANILISRCFLELGQYDNASKYISLCCTKQAIMDSTQYCQLLLFKTIIYIQSSQYKKAIDTANSILEIDQNYPYINSLYNQYNSHHLNGTRGLAVCPVKTHFNSSYWNIMAIPNSEEIYLNNTDKIHLSFALPHNNQGVLYLLQDNLAAAKSEFKLAIQLDSSFTISYINLASVYFLEQKYDQSLKELDVAYTANPKLDLIHLIRSLNYQALGYYDIALKHLNIAVNKNQTHDYLFLSLGDLYFQTGQLKQAFLNWEKAMKSPLYFYLLHRRLIYLNTMSIKLKEWISPSILSEYKLLIPFTSLQKE